MSLTRINNFSNLAKRTLLNYCQLKDKGRLLLFNDVKIHITNRSKGTKPTLYDIRRKNKNSISSRGYFLLGIPLVTFCLGTWQLYRLNWKLKLIEDLKSQLNKEPVDLLENINRLEDLEYRFVKVKGKFVHDQELLLGPRSLTSHGFHVDSGNLFSRRITTGWNVITPFKVADQNLTILVNRGWIPQKAKKWFVSNSEDIVEVTGILRKNEYRSLDAGDNSHSNRKWLYRDINAMADAVGASPIYIDLWSKEDPPKGPISCQTNVTLRNNHFSYMITWYTLSICSALIWFQTFIQRVPIK